MSRRTAVALALLAALVGFGVSGWPGSLLADAKPEHPIPEPFKQPPPSTFECRWADTPITLDGLADEPAWKHAQPITAFHVPWLGDGKARMARTATTAKLLWDREYLYFHCDMEDSDLFADVTEHDGDLWKNDVFEMFLRPDSGKAGYYEFQVNAAGAKFDAFYPKYDLDAIVRSIEGGQVPHGHEGEAPRHAEQARRTSIRAGAWKAASRGPTSCAAGGRPARGRDVEAEPLPLRLQRRLEDGRNCRASRRSRRRKSRRSSTRSTTTRRSRSSGRTRTPRRRSASTSASR